MECTSDDQSLESFDDTVFFVAKHFTVRNLPASGAACSSITDCKEWTSDFEQ